MCKRAARAVPKPLAHLQTVVTGVVEENLALIEPSATAFGANPVQRSYGSAEAQPWIFVFIVSVVPVGGVYHATAAETDNDVPRSACPTQCCAMAAIEKKSAKESPGHEPIGRSDTDAQTTEALRTAPLEGRWPGKSIVAKVFTPRNRPASRANVALARTGASIHMIDGEIADGMAYCARTVADDLGRFRFPPQDASFRLIVTHSSGYALIKSAPDWELTKILHLQPWARVEGDFRIGHSPVANATIAINLNGRPHPLGDDGPDYVAECVTTTGPGGRFVFDRVIPGRGRVGLCVTPAVQGADMVMDSLCMVHTGFGGGQTIVIGLRGVGRRVRGKLLPPDGLSEPVRWNLAHLTVREKAVTFVEESSQWMTTVDRDGRFCVEDMPPGSFWLVARFKQYQSAYIWVYRFNVAAPGGNMLDEQVDLGELKPDELKHSTENRLTINQVVSPRS